MYSKISRKLVYVVISNGYIKKKKKEMKRGQAKTGGFYLGVKIFKVAVNVLIGLQHGSHELVKRENRW